MRTNKKAIGILGGTFDPVHIGHLRMAIELQEMCRLAKIHVMPCYQPVHRELPIASPQQRLAMVECAIEGEPTLIADNREILRQEPSYTIDTLRELHKAIPNTPLCILIGVDAFLGFASWHRYQEILEKAHIILAHRPPYQLPKTGIVAELLDKHLKDDIDHLHETMAGSILIRPITLLEISATDIRNQIASGGNPRYLLPNAVYDYIQQHQIYQSEKS